MQPGGMPGMHGYQDAVSPCITVANLPTDMTRRELAHIFRPFQGFMVSKVNPTVDEQFLFCSLAASAPLDQEL